MKIQALAVIFVLIILPISIVLSEYVQIQMDTIKIQTQYDSQLLGATYDAVSAFQKNTVNSNFSDLTTSKMRDIEASANVFINSVANNFKMKGNSRDAIKEYIPAIVYTLYDGYYIYTPFTNALNDIEISHESTYQNGERIFGLKPYIYYSKEYNYNGNNFVITYSLDNYITIEGEVMLDGTKTVINDGGYLIDPNAYETTSKMYRGVPIKSGKDDKIYEFVNKDDKYECVKVNGTKYYLDEDNNDKDGIFYFVQNQRQYLSETTGNEFKTNYFSDEYNSAQIYYDKARAFTEKLLNMYQLSGMDIFSNNAKDIEFYNSNFNQERRKVIKESIQKNLSSAIANFNNISQVTNPNFQMPKLQEDEWDKIINNVSVISFLQGMSMGTRPYNGYAIVTNNKNEESVGEESIYITTTDTNQGEYHRINDLDLLEGTVNLGQGVFNVNFERKAIDKLSDVDGSVIEKDYYYPRKELACYNSIVNQSNINSMEKSLSDGTKVPETVYEYLEDVIQEKGEKGRELASLYYTALGRERQGLFKMGNNLWVNGSRESGS